MGTKLALVLEHNPDARSGLEELLRISGFEVDGAEDGTRALAMLSRHPDVVVLDLSLGAGDTLNVIKRVKAENERAFVVVFSGWHHLEATARAAGADAYILKPDVDALHGLLTRLAAGETEVLPKKKADRG